MSWKKIIFSGLAVAGFLLIVGLFGMWFWFTTTLPLEEETRIHIRSGSSGRQIGHVLKEAGVIDSVEAFRWAIWFRQAEQDLRSGTLRLEPPINRWQLVDELRSRAPILNTVRLGEGWPSWQILSRLAAEMDFSLEELEQLSEDAEFIKELGLDEADTLEGYLFPDTYRLAVDKEPREALKRLVERFWEIAELHRLEERAAELGLSLREAVTMASIIEREGRLPEELSKISAVFHNRLEANMRLQADPTVLYALGDYNANLTYAQLRLESPYNTYQNRGLPPGPICSPGLASLIAAVEPADTEALYFVARGDGSHVFSKNHQDHLEAVQKYQR